MIDKAHENGFEVTLLYVALRDENLAIKRVEDRVQKGGHGVPSEIIKKRYRQSNHNLSAVAFKSDNVFIYDTIVHIISRINKDSSYLFNS